MSNQKVAINGAKWTTTATIINTVLSFSQLAIIARFLEPSIFGLVSICSLVLSFFHVFANLGFTNSIISKQESDRKVLSTIFFASIVLGLVMGLLIYLSAGFVVDYYNEPRLSRIIKISSITFPIIYASQIYYNLLIKELKFKIIAIIDSLGSIINIIITVTLAYKGFQELSIIYSQVVFITLKSSLYVILGRNLFSPMIYFKLGEIKDHLRFGIYYMGEGILGFVNGNLENIVIGKAIGIKELGLYTIAYQLAIFPIVRLNPLIMQISYPIMAKMKENDGLKRAYVKIVDFITCCNYPLLAGLFITSSSVVVLLYGSMYYEAVPLIKIIVFVSFLACLTAPASSLALSKNKPNMLFYVNLISLAIKIPTLYFLAKYYGIYGIASGFVIATVIENIIIFYMVNSLVGNLLPILFKNIMKPIAFCLIMIAVILLYQNVIGNGGMLHLIAQIIIGGLIYTGFILKFKISLPEILAIRKSL